MQLSRQWGVLLLAALLPAGASVGSVSDEAPREPSTGLTIYTGNLALVRKELERVLPPGTHTLRIEGLPTNIDPASLTLLNDEVTLLGSHGFRSYQDSGSGPGASLELDLEVDEQVGHLSLAFLTSGLNWSADYSVIVAGDDASARLEGYATIVNNSGTSYVDAEVQLLAGVIQRGGRLEFDDYRLERAAAEMSAAPSLQEASFGDYHLYTVASPLSLRAGESRRIRLLGARSIKTRKEYVFSHGVDYRRAYPEPERRPVAVSYLVERPARGDVHDLPLPAGQVRLLQADDAGRIQLLGITSISNTPAGEDFRLSTGLAFDIVGTRVQTEYERPSSNVYESTWRVELRNRSDAAVAVQVIEQLTGDWRIVESSHPAEKLSSRTVRFAVEVPAGGESVLEYHVWVRT